MNATNSAAVEQFAARHGVSDILYGVGYSCATPHAVAVAVWQGYDVRVYPHGDVPGAVTHFAEIRNGVCYVAKDGVR